MKFSIKDISYIGMFIALITIGAYIKIDFLLVPFTLQTMFVFLAAYLLKPKNATFTLIIYILIGLIGIPVFAGGGGIAYLFKPSFGFLLSFIVAVYFMSCMILKSQKRYQDFVFTGLVGIVIIYGIATPYLYVVGNYILKVKLSFETILYTYDLPFIIKDVCLVFLTSLIALRIKKFIKD